MIYIRKTGSDTWHWKVTCSNYPDRSHWVNGTIPAIRESLGKELDPKHGTGASGLVTKADLVIAANAMEGRSVEVVHRLGHQRPDSGELCNECLAKDRA